METGSPHTVQAHCIKQAGLELKSSSLCLYLQNSEIKVCTTRPGLKSILKPSLVCAGLFVRDEVNLRSDDSCVFLQMSCALSGWRIVEGREHPQRFAELTHLLIYNCQCRGRCFSVHKRKCLGSVQKSLEFSPDIKPEFILTFFET